MEIKKICGNCGHYEVFGKRGACFVSGRGDHRLASVKHSLSLGLSCLLERDKSDTCEKYKEESELKPE